MNPTTPLIIGPGYNPNHTPYFTDGDVESALVGIGNFLSFILETLTTIANLILEAFKGSQTILTTLQDFLPSFDIFQGLLPSSVSAIVFSVMSIMAATVTFKIIGYFT